MVEGKVMEIHMAKHSMEEVKLSNDMREAIKTRCLLCQEVFLVNNMRSHVKQKHQIIITEYKEKQLKGAPYKLEERVLHRFVQVLLHSCICLCIFVLIVVVFFSLQ